MTEHYDPQTAVGAVAAAFPGGRPCFYCHRPVMSPFICWMGATADIAPHPACIIELTIRLHRDVHQIETTTHAYITGRTPPECERG